MEKTIEIPFGAKDSELKGWEYTIPEDMEAEIKDGKIIVKQKEREDGKIREELIEFLDELWHLGKNTNFDRWGKSDCAKWIAYLERRKEQKPVEWSEEDEKNLKLAYDLLVNGVEADRRYPELISWLKSLPKRLHLQPKQGWSETDKQMLENIIEVIGETCPGNYTASFITKMLSWLKSLRPQPHWKPSEGGGTEKHPWNDEDVEKAYREGMKAGAEWQREQYECIPAEEEYMRGFAQGAKEERKDLTPLINRLCEAILFEWKDAADLARKTLTQIKEREEK